jgi:ribosomal protein S21
MGRYDKEWDYVDHNFQPSKGGVSDFSRTGIPGDAVVCQPLQVKINAPYDADNFMRGLRAFRAITQKDKIVSQVKAKKAFEKPSDKRRRKVKESQRKSFENSQKQMRFEKGIITAKDAKAAKLEKQ